MSSRTPHLRLLALVTIPLAAGSLAVSMSARAQPTSEPFEVAGLFVELNDTDEDLGLHGEIDGGTWTSLDIDSPRGLPLLGIASKGNLRSQGMTQLAFESAEPSFDDLDPDDFFQRFPEGLYAIKAIAQEGGTFRSQVFLSHVLAAPPEATVSGLPAAEDCDATLPEVAAPVVIDWDDVTESHAEVGKAGPVTISRYQFFLEQGAMKLSLDLPPTVTAFEIPANLTAAGGVFKFEIIARTATGNNTAIESCFRMQ